MSNIPQSFDALTSRQENAAIMRAAGMSVSLIGNGPGDPQNYSVRNIRQEAGNAVAYGMRWDDALRAVTHRHLVSRTVLVRCALVLMPMS